MSSIEGTPGRAPFAAGGWESGGEEVAQMARAPPSAMRRKSLHKVCKRERDSAFNPLDSFPSQII
jgi:hypothetical protein